MLAKTGKKQKANKVINQLLKALKSAHEHLNWCNYGDSWERECADEAKLPEIITKAEISGELFLHRNKGE